MMHAQEERAEAKPSFMRKRLIDVKVRAGNPGKYEITPFEGTVDLKQSELICDKLPPQHSTDVGKDHLFKEGCHVLVFTVRNEDQAMLRFPETPEEAYWAELVGPNEKSGPKQQASIADIVPAWVSPDGLQLIVLNFNNKPKRIGYTLRLVDGNNNPHLCDPIMGNGNGGKSAAFPPASLATLAVAGSLVAAAGALFAFGYINRQQVAPRQR